ncbi:hypothetical protein G7Y89_g968 [Cudoniella acicularis]|uniref:FAD-binding PCMH-type domain-containing protein n=1 Tax=Cudoniella acicularis TaxID=354080 RepID=A0A8H4RW76_9HELO|nr:hypothetical protein G7Y89_g968 [Cudoniella acicularis]
MLLFLMAFLALLDIGFALPNPNSSFPFEDLLSSPERFGFPTWGQSLNVQAENLRDDVESGELNNCQFAVEFPTNAFVTLLTFKQAELTPTCRIDVSSAQDISTTIKVSKLTQCPFVVKSGGHAAFAGGSSIQNGMLINMARLNMVSLSDDRKITKVGPGNTWYDVYKKLDPLGASVVGGREAGVGVGGLALGGGISYFSGRYGWACDNVLNYEVVLANSSIVNASPTKYSDLYWALRGGSGTNFGVISRFDLATFEQGLLWGGSRFYSMDKNISLSEAFSNFVVDAPTDDFAHLYLAFVYASELGGFAANTGPVYGLPVANPPIFAELEKIPYVEDATGFSNLTSLTVALNQTAFLSFKTVTFNNDATLIKEVIEIFVEEASAVLDVPGIIPAFAFQPISLNIIDKMTKNGGNVLGLSSSSGPLTSNLPIVARLSLS